MFEKMKFKNLKENNLINLILQNKFKSILALLVILVGASFFSGDDQGNKDYINPTMGTVRDVVEVSGQLESVKDANLSFEKSGIVNKINVAVGDKVVAGQVLASLSGADAAASVREAEASYQAAQANLDILLSGSTEAEKDLKRQLVTNAESDLKSAEFLANESVGNLNNSVKDIVSNKMSPIFQYSGSIYRMTFVSCDTNKQSEIETERSSFDNMTATTIEEAKTNANKLVSFISKINSLLSSSCLNQDPQLSDERLLISSAYTSAYNVSSDVTVKLNSVTTAKNSLARAEKDLQITLQGADQNKVASSQAQVNQAYARLLQARAQSSKNSLVAPFPGIVSQVNVTVGELSSVGKTSISLISDSGFQVNASVSENDLSKIKLNSAVSVTFDAIRDETFPGTVAVIDPAAQVENGTSKYKIKISVLSKDDRLRQGMSSNGEMISQIRENVLNIPIEYLINDKGQNKVKVLNQEGIEEYRDVKVGLKSSDGNVEIVEGLTLDDKLVKIISK